MWFSVDNQLEGSSKGVPTRSGSYEICETFCPFCSLHMSHKVVGFLHLALVVLKALEKCGRFYNDTDNRNPIDSYPS